MYFWPLVQQQFACRPESGSCSGMFFVSGQDDELFCIGFVHNNTGVSAPVCVPFVKARPVPIVNGWGFNQ